MVPGRCIYREGYLPWYQEGCIYRRIPTMVPGGVYTGRIPTMVHPAVYHHGTPCCIPPWYTRCIPLGVRGTPAVYPRCERLTLL